MIKKSLDPKWDESFYFDLLYQDVKQRELVVNLKHAKRLLDNAVSQFLGEVNKKIGDKLKHPQKKKFFFPFLKIFLLKFFHEKKNFFVIKKFFCPQIKFDR